MVNPFDNRGGGQMLPPFLQGRTPSKGPYNTQPMITPRASVAPGEVKPQGNPWDVYRKGAVPPSPMITPAKPPMAPVAPVAPVPPVKSPTQSLFEFMKQDLEGERNKALADTRSSAANRGVFYGSPLTTSEGDINTQYLRGLGQLQAGLISNDEQQNLQRLSLIPQLLGRPLNASEMGGSGNVNDVMQTIGSLFAPRQGPTAPAITPAPTQKPLTRENFRR